MQVVIIRHCENCDIPSLCCWVDGVGLEGKCVSVQDCTTCVSRGGKAV